ncbi:nitroreductase family protein [Thermodesulfobacteriota bacterium]
MFIDIAKKRRSVKKYTAQPVEQEKIDTIIETALRVPSGKAARPWEFVVVNDRDLLAKLSVAKPVGAEFVKEAPAAIVVCADPSKSPLWVEDCAIAAVTMQYAAVSTGLGSRWAQIRGNKYNDDQSSRDYIAGLLGLPDNLEVACIIAIGYPGEEIIPYKREDLDFGKASYNQYGQSG